MKAAVVVFLGTNCNVETKRALEDFGFEVDYVDFRENSLQKYDLVVLPGGFSYGDYISSGRIAKFTPVIDALAEFINSQRGFVLGICNGFQILCEARFLKGALIKNDSSKFICKNTPLLLEFGGNSKKIYLPVAHKEGKYIPSKDSCEDVFLRYLDNPNGSYNDIAGIYNPKARIMGLMPHPERAYFKSSFGFCGREIFKIVKDEIKRG